MYVYLYIYKLLTLASFFNQRPGENSLYTHAARPRWKIVFAENAKSYLVFGPAFNYKRIYPERREYDPSGFFLPHHRYNNIYGANSRGLSA